MRQIVFLEGSNYYIAYRDGAGNGLNSFTIDGGSTHNNSIEITNDSEASGTGGFAAILRTNNSSAYFALNAEL